jgi:hypothetical protein
MEVSRESGERELIANPVEVGIKSFDEVRNVIKDVESEGGENLVSGLVDQVGRLTPEAFKAYGEQIEESVKFLNKAILGEYHLLRRNLDQAAVERLEVTYSFARRAVENFEKTSKVVDAQVIEQDYKIQLEVRQEAIRQRLKWGGVNEQLRLQAIMLEQEMVERYGRLDEMLVGGRGCPRGVMVGLELGLAAPTLADLGKAGYVGGGEVDGMVCPNCGAHLPRGNGDTCGHCGMTKDRWATISGTKCD